MKSENPTSPAFPSGPKAYFLASRPRTWPLSLCPVCIGVSMAKGPIDYWVFGLTLFFSLLIQIGTNFANDYFDFIKGADTSSRIGPSRATASGWIAPSDMWRGTIFIFLLAFLTAIPLMARAGLWSLPIAALCILFGILYTGGPKPLGYLGLGELLVMIFFGPVACAGAYYLQTFTLNLSVLIASLAPGLLSTSALIANNLRDYKNDAKAGKQTLIVRLGPLFGKWEYATSIVFAGVVPLILFIFCGAPAITLLPMIILIVAIPLIQTAFRFEHPKELIPVLQVSAMLLLLYTLLFSLSWLIA